jgi:hypothetical protein
MASRPGSSLARGAGVVPLGGGKAAPTGMAGAAGDSGEGGFGLDFGLDLGVDVGGLLGVLLLLGAAEHLDGAGDDLGLPVAQAAVVAVVTPDLLTPSSGWRTIGPRGW